MKLPSLTLLLPLVAAGNAGRQHQFGLVHTTEVLAELEAGIAGLTAMSRTMFLELELADKKSAGTSAQDILSEIIIEYNALLIYNHTLSGEGALEDKLSQRSLYASLGGWEVQTSGFLQLMADSAGLFKGDDAEYLAGNLTVFKSSSNAFQTNFIRFLPGVADLVQGGIEKLGARFTKAIDALGTVVQARRHYTHR